jgi:hypothetical protein
MVKVNLRDGNILEVQVTDAVVTRNYIDDDIDRTDTGFIADYLARTRVGAGVANNWVLNGTRLTRDHILDVSALGQDGIDIGLLDEDDDLLVYQRINNSLTIDNRDWITIQLSGAGAALLRPNDGDTNVIQVSYVRDFAGNWDPQNYSNTQELTFATTLTPDTQPSSDAPTVVWVSAHDNIYGIRDGGQTLISDIVYVQFSKDMSGDVLLTDKYRINTREVPTGTNITAVDGVPYGTGAQAGRGTLVTITMPFGFLGETQEMFITHSEEFYTAANYYRNNMDPYQPVDNHTVYVNRSVKSVERDAAGKTLPGKQLAGNLLFTTGPSYEPFVNRLNPITAYVNAFTDDGANQGKKEIATLLDAFVSDYVSGILLMRTVYNDITGAPYPVGSIPDPDLVIQLTNPGNGIASLSLPNSLYSNGAKIPFNSIKIEIPNDVTSADITIGAATDVIGVVNGIDIEQQSPLLGGVTVKGTAVNLTAFVDGDVSVKTLGTYATGGNLTVKTGSRIDGTLTVNIKGDYKQEQGSTIGKVDFIDVKPTSVTIANGAQIGTVTIGLNLETIFSNEGRIETVALENAGADIEFKNIGNGRIITAIIVNAAVDFELKNAASGTIAKVQVTDQNANVSILNIGGTITLIDLDNSASITVDNYGNGIGKINGTSGTNVAVTGNTMPPVTGGIVNITDNTSPNTATPTSL